MGDQQLLITSRSGVPRLSSDNTKDETKMVFIFMHTGKIFPFIQTFENTHKTEKESIHVKPNEPESSDNIDVMNICHSEK